MTTRKTEDKKMQMGNKLKVSHSAEETLLGNYFLAFFY